jgi:hypothetical protein
MKASSFALSALLLLVLGAAVLTVQASSYESETELYGEYRNAQYRYSLFVPGDLDLPSFFGPASA